MLAENNLNQVQALWTVPEIFTEPAPGRVLLQLEDPKVLMTCISADGPTTGALMPRGRWSWNTPATAGMPMNWGIPVGTMEGCMMAMACPKVVPSGCVRRSWVRIKNMRSQWWGDIEKTKAYCIAAIDQVCRDYGGDPRKIILRVSPGPLLNYLDCMMIAGPSAGGGHGHSHYEEAFASRSMSHGRSATSAWGAPLFLSHERSVAIQSALEAAHPNAKVTRHSSTPITRLAGCCVMCLFAVRPALVDAVFPIQAMK